MIAPRRLLLACLASVAAVGLAWPTAAGAHVEPTAAEVPAGSAATLEFTVEHGCEGSPTTKLELQVPEGVTDAAPVEKAGWTAGVADRVVTFEGGPLPDDEAGTFAVGFTAPDTVGETLLFPFVQTCEEGSTDWIQAEPDGDRPAPRVVIGEPDPNAPTTPTTPTTLTTEVPDTTAAATSTSEVDGEGGEDEPADDGVARAVAIGAMVVVISVVGVIVAARLRRRPAR